MNEVVLRKYQYQFNRYRVFHFHIDFLRRQDSVGRNSDDTLTEAVKDVSTINDCRYKLYNYEACAVITKGGAHQVYVSN